MADITGEQMELLEDIVDAYWEPRPEGKDTFMIYTASVVGTTIAHRGFKPGSNMAEDNERRADPGDLEELAAQLLIQLDGTGRGGSMHPTARGKQVIEDHRKKQRVEAADGQLSGGGGSGIGWDDTLPVLQAVVDLFPNADPGFGVPQGQINAHLGREPDDPDTGVKLEMLAAAGYVTGMMETDQTPGPLMAKPTEKALKQLAGWPGDGSVALDRLVTILDKRIAVTLDKDEKRGLQAFRDSAQQLDRDVASQVMLKMMMGETE